jgi:hypothetical protein
VNGCARSEEGRSHGVVATSKYSAKAIEVDEGDEDANEEEEDRMEAAAQGDDNDLDAFEVLFRLLSSSPTLRFVARRRSRSPLPHRHRCSRPH